MTKPVTIDRPIFILGPHRSGTTLLYKLLGRHPDVAFFSDADRRLQRS
ncbi:MAG: sulfotransferase, partial [Planctomycetota bacterium]